MKLGLSSKHLQANPIEVEIKQGIANQANPPRTYPGNEAAGEAAIALFQ